MNPIHRAFLRTPIGYLEVTGSDKGIQSLCFLDFRVRIHHVPSVLKSGIEQLEEYFAGSRKIFDLPFDLTGSPFQLKVWSELQLSLIHI